MDTLERLKEVLKIEYEINSKEEFERAVESFNGINLGIFTVPIHNEKGVTNGEA